MAILPDFSSSPYPNELDDAAMDRAEAAWISENDHLDDQAEAERAELECLKEAARQARVEAEAAMQEADRLEALLARQESAAAAQSTSARVAAGNIAAVDSVIKLFGDTMNQFKK